MGKSELKWTAYNKYLTTELRQQILNLTEVVKQFTALKCLHQHESEPASMPLFDDDSDFSTLNSEAVASLLSFCSSLPAQTYQKIVTSSKESTESQHPVLSTLCQGHKENLSLVLSSPMVPSRPPLQPFDQNVSSIVSGSHGPTNQQRTKVTAIVAKGTEMFTAALASVDVLFTDDEMARCNTSGTKDFQQLDSGKSGFLVSVLQRKFDSLCLSEQWNQIAARINTKCRGRGGLLFTDLRKLVCFENTEMAQLVYHLTWKHYGSVNWTEFSRCSTKLPSELFWF